MFVEFMLGQLSFDTLSISCAGKDFCMVGYAHQSSVTYCLEQKCDAKVKYLQLQSRRFNLNLLQLFLTEGSIHSNYWLNLWEDFPFSFQAVVFNNPGTTYVLGGHQSFLTRNAELGSISFRNENCSPPGTRMLRQARMENVYKQIINAFMFLRQLKHLWGNYLVCKYPPKP